MTHELDQISVDISDLICFYASTWLQIIPEVWHSWKVQDLFVCLATAFAEADNAGKSNFRID